MKRILHPIKYFFSDISLFFKALFFYLKNLPLRLLLNLITLISYFNKIIAFIKFEFIRRLIWSRGRRSRPAVHLGLITLITFILVFGGPFSNSAVVLGSIEAPKDDFLEAEVDVVAAETDVLTTPNADTRGRQEPYKYIVKSGDTLSSVGEKFNVSVNSIRYASNLSASDYLKVGQEITIPPVGGLWHTVKSGDTVSSIATKFKVAEQAVIDSNYLFPPYELSVGQQLIIPNAEAPSPMPVSPTISQYASTTLRQVVSRITGDTVGSGSFICPCSKLLISQYFSWYHPAIDIQSVGQSDWGIYSADSGTVVSVEVGGWNYGYGNRVVVDHGNGYKTTYSHLTSASVYAGQTVGRGEQLGIMGNTGRSYGAHLHFEVEYFGKLINPLSVL